MEMNEELKKGTYFLVKSVFYVPFYVDIQEGQQKAV